MLLDKFAPALSTRTGVSSCLELRELRHHGAALFMVRAPITSLEESVVYGLARTGWALGNRALAGIVKSLKYSDVPDGLRGAGITFITCRSDVPRFSRSPLCNLNRSYLQMNMKFICVDILTPRSF